MTKSITRQINDDIQDFYAMLRIRRIEEALADEYQRQEMRCPMHLSIGQEAIAVGVCSPLRSDDYVMSNHRGHAHYLAKGGSLNAMFAELYGKATGCAGGRGGSMHLIDKHAGFMGSAPIVGGTIPIAVGLAWAAQLQGLDRVTVAFLGDACFEEGVVHESMIFASLHRLPVVFACENNDFSVYTPLRDRQPSREIWRIAEAHSIHAISGDGNDIGFVRSATTEAVCAARAGEGPRFLELSTYRWREHCGPNFDNELGYREQAEIERGEAGCPILREQHRLEVNGMISKGEVEKFEKEIAGEIRSAFEFAWSSEKPSTATLMDHLWS